MANKKKRNKQYHGKDAAARPTFTKVSAVKRNPVHQYWIDHRRLARPALIALAIAFVVIVILIGIAELIWK